MNPKPCSSLTGRLKRICEGTDPRCRRESRRVQIERLLSLRLIERDPDEVEKDNAEPTRKVHQRKLVQTRIDEQIVNAGQVEPKRDKRSTLPPCIHLGEVTREESCRLCGGRRIIASVHACAIHGECTQNNHGLKGAAKYLATCIRCIDYSEIGGLYGHPRISTDPGGDTGSLPQDPQGMDGEGMGAAGHAEEETARNQDGSNAEGADVRQ